MINKISTTQIIAALLAVLLLSACTQAKNELAPESSPVQSSEAKPIEAPSQSEAPPPVPEQHELELKISGNEYIRGLAADTAKKITAHGMSETQRALAAYEYIIANTFFADPVGLDIWRVRGGGELPTYIENRALSPLAFGIGSCEDYAAALVLLLESMGIEAQYVPGLTYSVDGALVDHAWTIAKIDGQWYHLDSQLEDNVTRENLLRYRYFMRSDDSMMASHRWGENLIATGLLTESQNSELRKNYFAGPCPQNAATPAPFVIRSAPPPNIGAVVASLEAEYTRYELANGSLPPLELNIITPVFEGDTFPPKS